MASTRSKGAKRSLCDSPNTSNFGSASAKKKKPEPNFLHERFVDGKFSDITVKAFGREWKLHKVILSGSPYFMSLFTKGWKDSKKKVVQLIIPDQKVTAEAVDACFRSLYAYEVEIDESNVIQILAAASFLQLDDVIQKSHEFMVGSMDAGTVVEHYNASTTYGGGATVENASLAFLKNWITTPTFEDYVPEISPELMAKIVGSYDAFCLSEGALYIMLTKWLYLKVTGSNFDENLNHKDRKTKALDYFRQLDGATPFLSTEVGKPYVGIFREIRIKDILSSKCYSTSGLRNHKILPEDWIKDAVMENWEQIERVIGVNPVCSLEEQRFDKLCTREGYFVPIFTNSSKMLRCFLTGIVLSCEKSGANRVFKIERVSGEVEVKQYDVQEFWFRINLVVTEDNGRIKFSTSTGIKKVSLKVGETSQLLQIGNEFDDYFFFFGINYYVV